MVYQEQLKELVNIYLRSQKGENEELFDSLRNELRQLSNNWHELKKTMNFLFLNILSLLKRDIICQRHCSCAAIIK